MKKNDVIELFIEDISNEGLGIGKYEGFVFFVKDTAPGDEIIAGITALKKSYGYARVIEIKNPSKDRVEPKCPKAGICGGCSMMHILYKKQLEIKENKVFNDLVRIGGFDKDKIQKALKPIIGMESPYHYRNKSQYPIGQDKDGKIQIGFFAKRSHRIIESDKCFIGQESDEKILSIVRNWLEKYKIPIYNEKSHKGLVRHLIIRTANKTKEKMACLVSTSVNIPHIQELAEELKEKALVTSFCINVNQSKGNVILGKKTVAVMGEDYLTDEYSIFYKEYGKTNKEERIVEKNIVVRISANSFYQVNPIQMSKLYSKALECAELKGDEVVWDLYCGIGTITFALSFKASHVMGIEAVPQAIENAKENAKLNGIKNTTFFCGNAEDVLKDADSFGRLSRPDVVVLDPPRAGCDPVVLESILKANPVRVVYVSCNPSTLARDLNVLAAGGYEIREVTPVDQFCHGGHVETVVLIQRVGS